MLFRNKGDKKLIIIITKQNFGKTMNLKRCVFEEDNQQTVNSTRLQFDLYNWPERYDGGVSSLKQLNFVDWKTKKHGSR